MKHDMFPNDDVESYEVDLETDTVTYFMASGMVYVLCFEDDPGVSAATAPIMDDMCPPGDDEAFTTDCDMSIEAFFDLIGEPSDRYEVAEALTEDFVDGSLTSFCELSEADFDQAIDFIHNQLKG